MLDWSKKEMSIEGESLSHLQLENDFSDTLVNMLDELEPIA